MNKFKTQNPYTGFKAFDNNTYSVKMHSLSSNQPENYDDIDGILERNPSQEEKTNLALRFVKTYRLNANTYPFERLLSSGVSCNLQDNEGKSLLMIAAEKGSLELVQLLIEQNADVRMRDKYEKTALFYAVEANNENVDVVSVLLANGADPNCETQDRATPLLKAVEKGYYEITKILLEKGANIHAALESTGENALHIAAKKMNKKLIALILENGGDPNKRNRKKLTIYDICQNNPEMLTFLQSFQSPVKVISPHITKASSDPPSQQINERQAAAAAEEGNTFQIMDDFIDMSGKVSYKEQQNQAQYGQSLNRDQFQQDMSGQRKRKNQPYSEQTLKSNEKDSTRKSKGRNEPPDGVIRNNYFIPSTGSTNSNLDNFDSESNKRGTEEYNNFESQATDSQLEVNRFSSMNQVDSQPNETSTSQSTSYSDAHQYMDQMYRSYGNQNMEEGNAAFYFQQQSQGKKKPMANPTGSLPFDKPIDRELSQSSTSLQNISGDMIQYMQPQGPNSFRGNMAPSQLKGTIPQNYYPQNANPQFLNAAGPNQPYQKKKSKGQGNVKNFPNNGFNTAPMNQPNQPIGTNIIQNQFNRQGSANSGIGDPSAPGLPNNQMNQTNSATNKYNKGMNKGYQDKNITRGHLSPTMHPNPNIALLNMEQGMPHNIPQMVTEIPQNMMGPPHTIDSYSMQENVKNMKEVKVPMNAMVFSNSTPNISLQYPPSHMFSDGRGMNVPTQNPYMLSHPPVQPMNDPMAQMYKDPQSSRIMSGGMHQNMGQGNYGQPIPFNHPANQPLMMQKNQFIETVSSSYQNTSLLDNSTMQSNIKTFHFDKNNNTQQKNFKLKADLLSVTKIHNETSHMLEILKHENKDLKLTLEANRQNEQRIKKILEEKEDTIEELKKKKEDLEKFIKNVSSKSSAAKYEEVGVLTDPTNFQTGRMDDILLDPKQNVEFLKMDYISEALHHDITAFEKDVNNFNLDKKPVFDLLLEHIKVSVAEALPGAEWEIYGSFATGLCLPWSDIDIVLKAPQASFGTSVLDSLETNLKRKKWVEDVKTIRNTTVPVLKITCTKAHLNKKVDITLHDSRHNGIACVELVKDYLKAYPSLRPMVLVLKQFLSRINLNDTYLVTIINWNIDINTKAGRPQLLWVNTVSGFPVPNKRIGKIFRIQRAMEPIENQNLGSILLSFLHFYGFEYDYYTQVLVNPKKIPKTKENGNDAYVDNYILMNMYNQSLPTIMEPKIIIQDPLSNTNNVGRGTFQIKEIKHAFMAAYFEAFKPCVCEIHRYIEGVDIINGRPQKKCCSILKKMMLAYQPSK